MLQVVKRATIGDGGNHGAQLERGHGHSLPEGTHLANSAQFFGNYFVRVGSQLLARNVITGKLAQAILMGIEGYFLKTELTSQGFEISIIRMRQRLSQVHPAASAK